MENSRKENSLRWLLAAGVLGPAAAAYSAFAEWFAVHPSGSIHWLVVSDLIATAVLACVIAIIVSLVRLVMGRSRRGALVALVSCLTFAAFAMAGIQIGARIRHRAFVDLAERSAALVDAIDAFKIVNGAPPPSLDDLVPRYIAAIPSTGIGAYPEYFYYVGKTEHDHGNPWTLRVFTPTGVIDFDEFFYYPLQNYPEYSWDGNRVERIGDWAYLHE